MLEVSETIGSKNRRILVIDDNEAIHADFRKILANSRKTSEVDDSYSAFFGEEPSTSESLDFELDHASQGQEGLEKVRQSVEDGLPYAMAFVDIRMPPGWDGVETIGHLWEADPDLLVVVCTAYSDYNWTEMTEQLGRMDRWLILKKPFDNVEVRQLASSLTEKWDLARKADLKTNEMQRMVEETSRRLDTFRNAFDEAGLVAVTDAQGTFLEVNENFCTLSGYTRDELLGKNHSILNSGCHPAEFFQEMYSSVGAGNIWRGEICSRAKDGSQYWVDTTMVPMLDEDGEVGSYFGLRIEITERKQLLEQLKKLAYRDALTGLPNRPSILHSIQSTIERGDDHQFALLFLDFDRFKLINDSLGHDVGDELLKEIAHRLQNTLRKTDGVISARLGGDEFVVLLSDLPDVAHATVIAERLLGVFSGSYKLGPYTVYSTASIGIVTSEHRYQSAYAMLRDADVAMYEAKAAGKGCLTIFDQAMRDKAQTRLCIESELREAISQNEFVLFYQPIVSLESHELEGAEALIRWINPERGLINPDDFITIAEETGLIIPIGNWVLDEACRQFALWRRTLLDNAPHCIHVNVSRRQLLIPNLVTIVERILKSHAIPPECLHLEVTENIIMHDRVVTMATLTKLRELGVKIDMDDFGTGYSSLACLHEFPIDVLKIDRSFVANTKDIHDVAALLHSVLTLAENLGLQVVCEGIEDTKQLATLQALGCEYGQGYLFSKPLSVEDFENYVQTECKQLEHKTEKNSTNLPFLGPPSNAMQGCGQEVDA